jgi:hypothetical protein
MKPPLLYTPEAVAAFLRMCRDRQPRDLIAIRLGWTIRQVAHLHEHLCRHDRQPYPLAHRSHRTLRRQCPLVGREAEVRQLSQRDMSARAIGEMLGVTRGVVAGFMDRYGLYALHRRRYRGGRRPVSLTRIARAPAVDESNVRAAERAWAELEGVA